jgi:hypothetical protein
MKDTTIHLIIPIVVMAVTMFILILTTLTDTHEDDDF